MSFRHRWVRVWWPDIIERTCQFVDELPGIDWMKEDGRTWFSFRRDSLYGCLLGIGNRWGLYTYRVEKVDQLVASALVATANNYRAFFETDESHDPAALRRFVRRHEEDVDFTDFAELLLAVADVLDLYGPPDCPGGTS